VEQANDVKEVTSAVDIDKRWQRGGRSSRAARGGGFEGSPWKAVGEEQMDMTRADRDGRSGAL